jgi:hypothetical protein
MMLLLNLFQVFPALAGGFPTAKEVNGYVADGKQLLNIHYRQRRITFFSNSAQSFIQVVGQSFHLWHVLKYLGYKINDCGNKWKHSNEPQMIKDDSLWNLLTQITTCGFSKWIIVLKVNSY